MMGAKACVLHQCVLSRLYTVSDWFGKSGTDATTNLERRAVSCLHCDGRFGHRVALFERQCRLDDSGPPTDRVQSRVSRRATPHRLLVLPSLCSPVSDGRDSLHATVHRLSPKRGRRDEKTPPFFSTIGNKNRRYPGFACSVFRILCILPTSGTWRTICNVPLATVQSIKCQRRRARPPTKWDGVCHATNNVERRAIA